MSFLCRLIWMRFVTVIGFSTFGPTGGRSLDWMSPGPFFTLRTLQA